MREPGTARLDATAIGLSVACTAHCLALPFAAAILPALSAAAEAEWVHWLVVALAAPVALLALRRPGTPAHIRALAAGGLLLMALGAAAVPTHEWETPLSVLGGSLLAGAHALNLLRAHDRKSHHSAHDPGDPASAAFNDRST